MTKIKICGLFRPCDIDFVNEAKPDFIGFVFAKSRRQVSPTLANELRKKLHPSIIPVGVFVDAPLTEIQQLYIDKTIKIAQLHGTETEEYIQALKQLCPIPVIKAISVKTANDILCWENSSADFLLLDNSGGGTGKSFDWTKIPTIQKPFFLAGGIDTTNINAAKKFAPYCIDVSSGAETDNTKDLEKIKQLVQQAQGGVSDGFYPKTEY